MLLLHMHMALAYADVPTPLARFAQPGDPRLRYEGRWMHQSSGAFADWPCSTLAFGVNAGTAGAVLRVTWAGPRLRLNVTIESADGETRSATTWKGAEYDLPFTPPKRSDISVPPGGSLVRLRKLSSATPYAPGIGSKLLRPSVLEFRGIDLVRGNASLEAPPTPPRSIEIIGASDSAGYCVDGTPNTSSLAYTLGGWERSNCDATALAEVARRVDASLSVQAFAGAGLTQNANARQRWQMGKLTMADYYNRTLQTRAAPVWDVRAHQPPQLVLVSLGGNDYNHQQGRVPTNATFEAAYAKLLSDLFTTYTGRVEGTGAATELGDETAGRRDAAAAAAAVGLEPQRPVVVSICGQGSPEEARHDPDNNRCRSCPHVESSVRAFQRGHPALRVEYILIPCDGSVVTGEGDIGCNGHKNRRGQLEVARFLEPKLRHIMGW